MKFLLVILLTMATATDVAVANSTLITRCKVGDAKTISVGDAYKVGGIEVGTITAIYFEEYVHFVSPTRCKITYTDNIAGESHDVYFILPISSAI